MHTPKTEALLERERAEFEAWREEQLAKLEADKAGLAKRAAERRRLAIERAAERRQQREQQLEQRRGAGGGGGEGGGGGGGGDDMEEGEAGGEGPRAEEDEEDEEQMRRAMEGALAAFREARGCCWMRAERWMDHHVYALRPSPLLLSQRL